jgi:RNA polymerase sigma factor (sigma-70 family)
MVRGEPERISDSDDIAASISDGERFGAVVERHFAELYRYLARRVGADADDLAAETFAIAFRRRGDYQLDRPDMRPWLYGIATNLVRRHRRSEMRRLAAYARSAHRDAHLSVDASQEIAAHLDGANTLHRVAAAFARLDDEQRDVLFLVAICGLAYGDAAEALDLPVGTVHSRIARARKRLRDLIESSGQEPSTAIPRPTGQG